MALSLTVAARAAGATGLSAGDMIAACWGRSDEVDAPAAVRRRRSQQHVLELPCLRVRAAQESSGEATANYASITNNFVGGYDLSYGDPRDRYVYATVAYTLE
jgi:hypothetical protein